MNAAKFAVLVLSAAPPSGGGTILLQYAIDINGLVLTRNFTPFRHDLPSSSSQLVKVKMGFVRTKRYVFRVLDINDE